MQLVAAERNIPKATRNGWAASAPIPKAQPAAANSTCQKAEAMENKGVGLRSRAFSFAGRLFDWRLPRSAACWATPKQDLADGIRRLHPRRIAGPKTLFAVVGLVAHFNLRIEAE